jgi:BirA family biotin operon repressor/biotin-[acetyl-CoA-carboxylase] ligase
MLRPLLPEDIRVFLSSNNFGQRLFYYPETTSTNDRAVEFAKSGEPEGTVVYADAQTSGRGRGSHVWSSSPRRDLLFSIILRPDTDALSTLPLTLALSLGLSVVLSKRTGEDVWVKWPNDLVTSSGKICGILAEGASTAGRSDYVVVGFGINVNSVGDDFPVELRGRAASCRTLTGNPVDRADLLADVVSALEGYYQRYLIDGFSSLVSSYVAKSALDGKRVRVTGPEVDTVAVVVGVQNDGALIVREVDGGETLVLYSETVEMVR